MITTFFGPMRSGKTEAMIHLLERERIRKKKIIVVKPKTDDMFSESHIVSRSGISYPAIKAETDTILEQCRVFSSDGLGYYDVYAFDEVQFFSAGFIGIILKLSGEGKHVVCAGLDKDFRGVAFETVLQCIINSDNIEKMESVCEICGGRAIYTKRLNNDIQQRVLVGDEHYIPVCLRCYGGF